MLKTMAIIVAVLIALVNVSAQSNHKTKGFKQVPKAGVVRVGPPTTYLKEGLTAEQVLRILGEPINVTERDEAGVTIKTYEFRRGANRILIAEFVKGALVSSRTETRTHLVAHLVN
jgi:hypothetical protein